MVEDGEATFRKFRMMFVSGWEVIRRRRFVRRIRMIIVMVDRDAVVLKRSDVGVVVTIAAKEGSFVLWKAYHIMW